MSDAPNHPDELVGIGAAARRYGLAESALRYWEQRGLLRPARRRSRWRLYGPEELHRMPLSPRNDRGPSRFDNKHP